MVSVDRLVAAKQVDTTQFGGCVRYDRAGSGGQAIKLMVVEHHRLTVSRDLHVKLDAVTRRDGGPESPERVFDAARSAVVVAAMGEGEGAEGGGKRDAHQRISKMPSISTATPSGSAGAETAERE